jgi:hypothetical protein
VAEFKREILKAAAKLGVDAQGRAGCCRRGHLVLLC